MMLLMPMVTAWVGTSSMLSKKRAFTSRVFCVSSTTWVMVSMGSPGLLNAMWPFTPMPRMCRSSPPAASMAAS